MPAFEFVYPPNTIINTYRFIVTVTDAEHVGRHLVVSVGHLSEAGSSNGVHVALWEDEP